MVSIMALLLTTNFLFEKKGSLLKTIELHAYHAVLCENHSTQILLHSHDSTTALKGDSISCKSLRDKI